MLKLLNLLTLIKYFIDGAIAAYKLIQEKMEEAKEKKRKDAVEKLKDSKTEEEQKDALRDIANNP